MRAIFFQFFPERLWSVVSYQEIKNLNLNIFSFQNTGEISKGQWWKWVLFQWTGCTYE
jgi:hypothetical protein